MRSQAIRSRIVVPVGKPPIENGAVVINGSRITAVSPWEELPRPRQEAVTDLGEVILLPGFINCHCHLDYTEMAGMIPRLQHFADWIKAIIAIKATWSYTEFAKSWITGAHMLEQSGVTSVVDIEAVPELLPEVWNATPLRLWSCLELINVKSPDTATSMVKSARQKAHELETQHTNHCGLSPHALYTASDDLLQQAEITARAESRLLTTHVAESSEEDAMYHSATGPLYQWLRSQGRLEHSGEGSPISILDQLGYFNSPVIAAHVNYLAPNDPHILAAHGVTAVHCPRSHHYFGHDAFPWQRLNEAGVNITLGTDSLASIGKVGGDIPRLDFFAEFASLAATDKAPPPHKALKWATTNAAKAIHQENELGQLSPGFLADIIAIPYAGTIGAAVEAIVGYRGSVAAAMIHGRWIIQDGDNIRHQT
ncbi:MAG: Aminodeoxyfutalosine deaminase [Verrucomicrobia subdivision 3 bacterium]|nr:Aminodeoxyfutalosine deaminase [Limisphaerales bacterium]MCS1412932.1 Aminodeoxyfutalosine deaminase [Limisphaerales bacterium]